MKQMKPVFSAALLGLSLSLGAVSAYAEKAQIEDMAGDLIKLRGEVEELQAKIDNKKETHKNRMASLAVQRTDLETQLQRNSMELKQLKTSIKEAQQRTAQDSIQGKDLKPLVMQSIAQIKQYIAKSLPFKTVERLTQLSEIEDQVQLDLLPPHKAVNRLWAFVDDEIRLTKESGIYRQPIKMDGKEILADVARVGMVLMYFQNGENSFGKVVKHQDDWLFVNVHDTKQREDIIGLFDSLKKQIRTGQFTLPNSLSQADAL